MIVSMYVKLYGTAFRMKLTVLMLGRLPIIERSENPQNKCFSPTKRVQNILANKNNLERLVIELPVTSCSSACTSQPSQLLDTYMDIKFQNLPDCILKEVEVNTS